VRFAHWVFLLAGIVGLLEIVPLYFLERLLAPLTHPEFYYGFLGVVLAWQVAFLAIARDPQRFRPIMPAAILEKLTYVVAMLVLLGKGRVGASSLGGAALDSLWIVLFTVAWMKTESNRS
jgi:hypothetical protein